MALVPTILAIVIGTVLGLRWGGTIDNLTGWRPVLPLAFAGGLTAQVLTDVVGLRGGFATFVALVGLGAYLAFAVLNVRTGGMVLVAAGLGLNLLVTLLNWGRPVSGSALVSAGVATEAQLDTLQLGGGRELADGTVLGFLGDVIPLPWGHVLSIGDLLVLMGLVLVTASVLRRYEVAGGPRSAAGRRGGRFAPGGPSDYRSALDALGRGPAPRRGPGLHPSRLEERRRANRRGTRPRAPQGRRPGPRPR